MPTFEVFEDALKHTDPELVCTIDWIQSEVGLDLKNLARQASLGSNTLHQVRRRGAVLKLDSFQSVAAVAGVKRSEALRRGEMLWERLWRLTPMEEVRELGEKLLRDRGKLEQKKPSATKELGRGRLDLALTRIDALIKERGK